MADERTLALTLPLVDDNASIGDALAEARASGAGAVVSTDGTEFWLHPVCELTEAADRHDPAATVGTQRERKVPALSAPQATEFGIDFPSPKGWEVRETLDTLGDRLVIASAVHSADGGRAVVALTDIGQALNLNLVTGVWECPVDGKKFFKSGQCRKHNKRLNRVA
jgi:hypothetical protein